MSCEEKAVVQDNERQEEIQKSKTVVLIFFGLVKNVTSSQLAGYSRWLVDPWRAAGWDVKGVMHTHRVEHVTNPRAEERGISLFQSKSIAAFSNLVPGLVVSVTDGADSDKLFYPASMIRTHQHWAGPGEIVTKRNFIRQLHSLELGTALAKQNFPDAELYIFVRPDVLFSASVAPFQPSPQTLIVPRFHPFGGFNDRFAMCGRETFEIYGTRFQHLAAFLKVAIMHAETFLKWVLVDKHRLGVNQHPGIVFGRIRANGKVSRADVGLLRR